MLGNPEWTEQSIYNDDYLSEEEREFSPLDDDYVREEYQEKGD